MIATVLATAVRVLCGCPARWTDTPVPAGPRIYYANHTSHLDALVVWAALTPVQRRACRIVAAADYWEAGPWRRWLARDVFRAVLIDRTVVTRTSNPLTAMLTVLDAGAALIIFPEGGRSADQTLQEFRPGLWHLVRKRPELPLTPVWLENLSRILPKGETLPVPLIGAVTFGGGFRWNGTDDKATFLTQARERLRRIGSGEGH